VLGSQATKDKRSREREHDPLEPRFPVKQRNHRRNNNQQQRDARAERHIEPEQVANLTVIEGVALNGGRR
jgi:hypothetical protein